MGAAEHKSVDARCRERRQVLLSDSKKLGPTRDARLNKLDKPRARLSENFELGCRSKSILVRPRLHGADSADHADAVVASLANGSPHRGLDDLNHGNAEAVGVALTGIPKHRGRRRVARDHEELDPLGNEIVEHIEGILAHVGDGLGAIR